MTKEEREQKARIFAKYWGCEIIGNPDNIYNSPVFGRITGITESHLIIQYRNISGKDWENSNIQKFDEVKLRLFSLEDISDEHAIEVAKMAFNISTDYPASDYKIIRPTVSSSIQLYLKNDWYDLQLNISIKSGMVWMSEEKNARIGVNIYDYLRSQSYDLDNLIESGIAVEKEVKGE